MLSSDLKDLLKEIEMVLNEFEYKPEDDQSYKDYTTLCVLYVRCFEILGERGELNEDENV